MTTLICSHGLALEHICHQCTEEGLERVEAHKPKSRKAKTCKSCKQKFVPVRDMQSVCGPQCGLQLASAKRLQKERKETRKRLDAMATLPELKKKAQMATNCFVRTRDTSKNCISCSRPLSTGGVGGGFDAGHFRSVGSAAHLRFDERNIHGQCKHCNNYLAGNPHGYRTGYIERFGLEALLELEADNTPRNYTREELITLAADYRKRTRELLK